MSKLMTITRVANLNTTGVRVNCSQKENKNPHLNNLDGGFYFKAINRVFGLLVEFCQQNFRCSCVMKIYYFQIFTHLTIIQFYVIV